MRNRKFNALVVLLLLVISMLFTGCSVETVDEHNSRMNLTQDIEETTSITVKAEIFETRVEKETAQSDENISQVETSVNDTVTQTPTQRVEPTSPIQATEKPQTPIQSSVETAPPNQTVQETDKKTVKVKIAIRCEKAVENWDKLNDSAKNESIVPKGGIILDMQDYNAKEGDTAFDVLKSACESNGISLNYTGNVKRKTIYINGINGLYERDCGSASGWVYSINNEFPTASSGGYTVKDGDIIEFHFTDGSKVF
ncbi:MAG TPA: DUF4430 domain-containing protein [Clostridiales bacterium]|nr:DUF4430 domain-containing protein [Clostridiales bacterium]